MALSNRNFLIVAAFEAGYYLDGDFFKRSDGKVVAKNIDDKGYYSVSLGGITSTLAPLKRSGVKFHRLVAYKKFGEEMFSAQCVRHLDGNSLNNSEKNLLLGTHKQNMHDIDPSKRMAHAKVAAKVQRKLSDSEVLCLKEDREGGMLYLALCTKYGIAKSTVSYILNNKTYQD